MGKISLEPWLADFLWEEIASVITWKKEIAAREIKPDPDSRFSDDGSNFRSHNTGGTNAVQLIQVLSVKDGATVILSDSKTSIKARLSSDAISILEDEADEKFSFETTHDVFQLKGFTVVSTPLGEEDGHVQLSVEKIEYDHHLRKTKGDPTPVQHDENIQQLIQDIVDLRYPQLAAEDQEEPSRNFEPASQVLSQQNGSPNGSAPTIVVPRSSMPASKQHSQASSLQMQTQRQTQHPVRVQKKVSPPKPVARSKPLGRTLPKDGFEFEAGVNLDNPVGPSILSDLRLNKMSADANLGSPQTREAKRSRLMALFQTRKAPPEPRIRQQATPQITATQNSPEVVIAETSVKPRDQSAEIQVLSPSEHGIDASPGNNAEPNQSPPSAQPPVQPTQSSLRSSGRSRVAPRRHKIPKDQQKLLEHPSSWLPPLPGHQFPRPNVPIALLQKWNQASLAFGNASRSAAVPSTAEAEDSASSMDTSDSLDDSDEEFPESQWPPTPPQKRPALPPDSSFGSRPGSSGDLEVAAPRALPVRKSPLNQVQHSLPQRPAVTVSPYFPDQGQPLFVSQAPSQPSPGLKRPLPEDAPLQTSPEAASQIVTPEQKQQAGPQKPFVTNPRSTQLNSQSGAFESRKRPRTNGSSPNASHSPFKSSLPSRTPPSGPCGWYSAGSIPTNPYARPLSWKNAGSPAAASSSTPDGPLGWSSHESTRRNSTSRPMSGRNGDGNVGQTQLSHSTPQASAPRGSRVTDHYSPYSYHNPPMVGRQPSRRNDESYRSASRQSDDLRRFSYQAPTASLNGQDQSSTSQINVDYDQPRKTSLHDSAELMQNSTRSEWVYERYVPDERGDFSFFEVRWNYMKMHGDDEVTPTEFREAILTAFPDLQTDAYRTRFTRLGLGTTATKEAFPSPRIQHASPNGQDHSLASADEQADPEPQLTEVGDPAEIHRMVRREFLQNSRRIEWLKEHFAPDRAGKFFFQDIRSAYISMQPNGTLSFKQLRDLIEAAFHISENKKIYSTRFKAISAKTQRLQAERKAGSPQRVKWLQENYTCDKKGTHHLKHVWSAYKSMHPDDEVPKAKFQSAARKAFPMLDDNGQMAFAPRKRTPASTQSEQLGQQAENNTATASKDFLGAAVNEQVRWLKETYIPDKEGRDDFQKVWSIYSSTHSDDLISKTDFNSAVREAFPKPRGNGLYLTFTPQVNLMANSKARSSDQIVQQKAVASTSASADNATEAEPIKIRQNGEDPASGPGMRSEMQEFCENWLNIRPGGYCAEVPPKRRIRRNVDVLGWEF